MFEQSKAEQESQIIGPLREKAELDAKYGKGAWRAMVRFALWQDTRQKWRLIDNGRTSRHNDAHRTSEKIHITSVEMGIAIAQRLRSYLGPSHAEEDILRGTTDMKSAYRQVPVHPDQQRFHIVALWHPSRAQWMFAELHALCFGLSSAVLQFNRVPCHFLAFMRR